MVTHLDFILKVIRGVGEKMKKEWLSHYGSQLFNILCMNKNSLCRTKKN